MASNIAHETPIVLTIPAAPEITLTTNNVVLLVWLVKSKREIGCEPYIGKQDIEIVGRWIRKMKETMIQIKIPENLHVNCATQLLSNRSMTWWERFIWDERHDQKIDVLSQVQECRSNK